MAETDCKPVPNQDPFAQAKLFGAPATNNWPNGLEISPTKVHELAVVHSVA